MKKKLENTVKKYLEILELKTKWNNDQKVGSGYFYSITYKKILCFFEKHESLDDELALKVALIYSWNQTICKIEKGLFEKAEKELKELKASQYYMKNMSIKEFDIEKNLPQFWKTIKKATSKAKSNSGVSVTKFSHFSFPGIFPMIDTKRMKSLTGKNVNQESYADFLKAWKSIYKKYGSKFDKLSREMNMPASRILDIMIFTPAQKKKKGGTHGVEKFK